MIMPPHKKKINKNLRKDIVVANETSQKVTIKPGFNDSNNETGLIMEPSEGCTRPTTAVSTSKASPSGRNRSFMQLSIAHSSCIPNNDDRNELREEREEKIQNKSWVTTDNSLTRGKEERQGMSMTLDEMQEHVSHCLLLNTENKINSKNAFALKLIDCMSVISKNTEDSNFSAMACQLDAGAKIYSSRVDAVHHQAMKLVETCMFGEKRAGYQRTELEGREHFSDDESPDGDKIKDARKKSKKKVIAKISDQIVRKLKGKDPREEFLRCDPLPGGIFDKVRSDPEDLSLSLLKHTPFWVDWQSYKPVKAEGISKIRTIKVKNNRLGPVLRVEKDIEMTTIPKLFDSSHGEKIVDLEDNPLVNTVTDEVETVTNNEAEYDSDIVSAAIRRMKEGQNEVSRLDAMKTVFHSPGESDYHYLKMNNSYYWAGPNYWKRPRGLNNDDLNLRKITMKKKNEPMPIDYTGSARTISLQRSSGVASKRTTTSGYSVLAKWTKKKVTLPQEIQFEPQTLLMLFHVERSSDNIRNNSQVDGKPYESDSGNENETVAVKNLEVAMIEVADDTANENNKRESQNFEEDSVSGQQNSDKEESKEGNRNDKGTAGACDVYEGENLVPMVKTVKYDPIKYSAKPIRVDMRHLKQVLLAVVLRAIADEEKEITREGGEDTPCGSVRFRHVLSQLFNSDELHCRSREDLTPAMTFLALLSVASEHALRLVKDETGDVIISLRRCDSDNHNNVTPVYNLTKEYR